MPASANGAAIASKTPVKAKSSDPSTLKHRQSPSTPVFRISNGTFACGQTIESSSAVRVMAKKPCKLQAGIGSYGSKRQTANTVCKTASVSFAVDI